MYLMYVDESGDVGLQNSPTAYFILSGLVVHELRWDACLEQLVRFRQRMRGHFGILMREEIHAAHFITRPGALRRIPKYDRLAILRHFLDEIAQLPDVSIVNIVVDKSNKPNGYDVLTRAWEALMQRFSNTMRHRNFPGPANADERGLVLPDQTDVKAVTRQLRKMRRWNPVPNNQQHGPGYRNLQVHNLVEDPFFKQSDHSYFIQACDCVAYFLYQELSPNAYIRKKGGQAYFNRVRPVLCTVASSSDPRGIKVL